MDFDSQHSFLHFSLNYITHSLFPLQNHFFSPIFSSDHRQHHLYQSMSKMKKKTTTVDAVDRTLQLPEHLQHRILSSLPFEDAVRTSVLSKRWKNIWITALTTLEFDNRFFDVIKCKCVNKILVMDEDFNEVDPCPCKARKEEGLLNFVERTLRIRHSQMVSLEKLLLHLPFYRSTMASFLEECIRYAQECSVKIFDLKIRSGCFRRCTLPQTVFAAAKSLTNLSLDGCNFESSNLNLCFLKTLNLHKVFVDDFQNLIANCPVIENLSLDYCHDAKGSLKICGIVNPYLVMVKVWHCQFQRLEIAAPGLQSFSFNGSFGVQPCEISVSNWKNMRELSLFYFSTTDRWFRDHISRLPFLEKLSLKRCNMLESIKIVSCRLKHFAVDCCSKLVKVEIDDPNLTSFNYGAAGGNMISLSTNALVLHRVVLSLYPLHDFDHLWYANLIEFLGKLNNVKVLKFARYFSEHTIVPKEMRITLLPPLHNFKHLTLKYNEEDWSSEEVEEFVDGALWFSSHPVTCYSSVTHKNGVMFKFHQ